MKRNKKQLQTTQSADPQGLEQETELCPPPSRTACGSSSNCFPKISLFKKRDRVQERHREEKQLQQVQRESRGMDLNREKRQQKTKGKKQRKQEEKRALQSEIGTEQFQQENIRSLEETVKHLEMEIVSFRAREEKLKEKLEKMKEKMAIKEQKTMRIVKRDENLTRELQALKERLTQKEKQREEEKVTNQNSMEATITVSVKDEMARQKHTERKEQRKAERTKKLCPHRELSSRPVKEAQRWSSEKSVIDRIQQESAVQELHKPEEKEKPEPSTPSPSDHSTHPSAEDRVRDESGAVPQEAGPQPQAFTECSGGAVCIEVDSQQIEPAARSSSRNTMLHRLLSTVQSLVQVSKFKLRKKKEKTAHVSPPCRLIPLGAPTGVLTVHLKTCGAFGKTAPVKKGTWATVRVTIGGMVKYSVQQPYSDPMCFNEWKHFSIQIQEEVSGVHQSSLIVVELIISDTETAAPRIIGRDSIKLQEILKKSSVNHQFDLRLGRQKVCKLDAELAFTYGSFGYGYSHQIKHTGRTVENLVENSLFPRCRPNEEQRDPYCNVITPSTLPRLDVIPSVVQQDTPRGAESRISAALMDCIRRRDRLLQLRKGLEECRTGEDRVQFLEKLILRKSFGTSYPSRKNGGF
ncbi:hypothetical protein AOLI_G00007300 [Acnodon oligacanthus]